VKKIIAILLLSLNICSANFINPTSIFTTQEKNQELLIIVNYSNIINFKDIISIKKLKGGTTKQVPLLIITNNNHFVFKEISYDDAEYIVNFQIKLYNKGIKTPQIYKTNSEEYVLRDKGKAYYLMDYLESDSFEFHKSYFNKIGTLAARINNINYSPEYSRTYKDRLDILESKYSVLKKYKVLNAQYKIFKRNWIKLSPKFVKSNIHNDLHIMNVLFKNNEISTVIDYDIAQYYPRIVECNATFFSHNKGVTFYSKENVLEYLKAYQLEAEIIFSYAEMLGILEIIRSRMLENAYNAITFENHRIDERMEEIKGFIKDEKWFIKEIKSLVVIHFKTKFNVLLPYSFITNQNIMEAV